MSFKAKLLQIYAKYDLSPTTLSRKLGYDTSEKIARLTRDEKNLPSIQIIQDILNSFPEINARWLIVGENDMLLQEDRVQYGFCKECLKKEGVIEHLKKEISAKDKQIQELLIKGSQSPGDAVGQPDAKKKAS